MKDAVISWFPSIRNVREAKPVKLATWLTQRPRSDVLALLGEIREEEDKTARTALKERLPCCTPTGFFKPRGDDNMRRFSGYLQLDIDPDQNKDMDPEEVREEVFELPYIAFAGLSVSGKGVWALARVSGPDDWKCRFYALEESVYRTTHIVLDRCTDVISQPRFFSYDPDCLIKEAKMFDGKRSKSILHHSPVTNDNRRNYSHPYIRVPKEHFKAVVEFNQASDMQTVLEELGWIYTKDLNRRSKNERLVYYTRPGKSGKEAFMIKSGSVSIARNTFYCHSTNANVPAKEHLTPFDVIAFQLFNGDVNKAIRYIFVAQEP